MSELLDIKSLYSILVREMENDSLQYIQPSLYRDIASLLGTIKGQGYDGLEAKVKTDLTKLLGEIATLLISTRMEKMKNSTKVDYSNLTEEEQHVQFSQKDLGLHFHQLLSTVLEGRVKALEALAEATNTRLVLLRFIRPSQAISGVDNTKYGPFEQEDIALLPFESAKLLIQQGVAMELPQLYA